MTAGADQSGSAHGRPRWGILRYRRTLIVVGALVSSYLLPWLLDARAHNQLEALVGEIRARGEPLSVAELEASRPRIPDEENMALLLLKQGQVIYQTSNNPRDRADIQDLVILGTASHPPLGEWLSPAQREAAIRFLEAVKSDLDALHAAVRLPFGRYPLPSTVPPVSSPHLSAHRHAVKLLCLEA